MTAELKLFIGKDHDTGTLGAQGMGNENFYGTVVPDHIGDNYAFIKSATIVGTTLTLAMTAEPVGVDKVIIAGEEIAVTYAADALTGTVSQRIVGIFSKVNGNTDSIGDAPVGTPPKPNNTTFVSANATTASNQDDIEITFNDTGMYAMVHTEWAIKVNSGAPITPTGASGHDHINGYLKFPKGTYAAGDTITISHLTADSGVVQFTDKPVTNSLT